jgi:hypothetical protein
MINAVFNNLNINHKAMENLNPLEVLKEELDTD